MSDHTLQQLAHKLDQLILQHERLRQDNELLQQREQQWLDERARLIEKNRLARTRVETMIIQLKRLKEGAE